MHQVSENGTKNLGNIFSTESLSFELRFKWPFAEDCSQESL